MAKLPKKPKAPKTTAAIGVWERYEDKLKEHDKKVKKVHDDHKKKQAIIAKTRKSK